MTDTRHPVPELGSRYRRLFILDSRDRFAQCRGLYDPRTDAILTYDFGLKREIEQSGGVAFYVDHLVDRDTMQKHNFRIYEFFRAWHRDASGSDLFSYRGVPFGFSFRLEYWNDYVFLVRARVCLEQLRAVAYDALYVGTELGVVESLLRDMEVAFEPVAAGLGAAQPRYYFPIHRWLEANIRRKGFKGQVIDWGAKVLGTALAWFDRISPTRRRLPGVLAQDYYPTRDMIRRLRREGRVRVVAADVSRDALWSRYIPRWSRRAQFEATAAQLLDHFRAHRSARLELRDGLDLTERAYAVIEQRIEHRVADALCMIADTLRYLEQNPLQLELLIANIGDTAPLVDCVCRSRGIPSYLVINGIMAAEFLDEAKYATVINGYSTSIKAHYFRGMNNVVCLGDPRMDRYPPNRRRGFDPDHFTVTIGASGHSSIDLNSYVAAEFEFLGQVLAALRSIRNECPGLRVIVKVRANGYIEQYRHFTAEYYPGLVSEIIDQLPMRTVLEGADLFISIYSQTLFEASCLGIPAVYYRADDQILDPPFNGQSELVTVDTVEDLERALREFRSGHSRFDAFLDRSVMAKYIGPLDGHNLDRNVAFLYHLLATPNPADLVTSDVTG